MFRVAGVREAGSDLPSVGRYASVIDVVAGPDGETYVAVEGACYRADPVNEEVVWQAALSTNAFGCDLALAGDTLLVRSGKCCLAALDARTGMCRWRIDTPAYATGLAVMGGVVYAQSDTNELAGYALADGRKVWAMTLPWELEKGRDEVTLYGADDGALVCHPYSDRSHVVGIDLAGLAVRWRTPVGDCWNVCGLDGTLYMMAGSNLVCRTVSTGATRWERTLDLPYRREGGFEMSADKKGVFVACWPHVWRISSEGALRWHWENRAVRPDKMCALPKGRLLVVMNTQIFALEPGDPAEEYPSRPAARLAQLRELVARAGELTWDEKWELDRWRAEAAPLMIQAYGQLLDKRPNLTKEEEERLSAYSCLIEQYADVSESGQLEEVLSRQKGSVVFELPLLWDLAAKDAAARTYVARLRREPAGTEEWQTMVEFAGRYLAHDCRVATDYLAEVLEKREPRELLHVAYVNGARNGTARQAEQVLAIRREQVPFTGDPLPAWLAKELGVLDAKAPNPLAPERFDLTEEERVLQAVFDARFRFTDTSELCVVALPKGQRPLAFTGRNSCTLCWTGQLDADIAHRLKNYRVAYVTFGEGEQDPLIQWNESHGEAKVTIRTWYGPLEATGYVVEVRKVGGEWVPVRCEMSWIS